MDTFEFIDKLPCQQSLFIFSTQYHILYYKNEVRIKVFKINLIYIIYITFIKVALNTNLNINLKRNLDNTLSTINIFRK